MRDRFALAYARSLPLCFCFRQVEARCEPAVIELERHAEPASCLFRQHLFRTARAVPTPWLCRKIMISRTAFCSAQAAARANRPISAGEWDLRYFKSTRK